MKKFSCRFMARLVAGLALTVIVSPPASANYGCPGGGRRGGSPSTAPPIVRPIAPPPSTFIPGRSGVSGSYGAGYKNVPPPKTEGQEQAIDPYLKYLAEQRAKLEADKKASKEKRDAEQQKNNDDTQTQTDRMHFKLNIYTNLNNQINELNKQLRQQGEDNDKAADSKAYYLGRLYEYNKNKEALERDKKYLIKGHPDQQQYATVKALINKAEQYVSENTERIRLTRANINELKTKIRNKEAERDSLMKRY